MARETDELLDHDYDGIKEYDNPLPLWWLWILYGSIIFAVGYVAYYHFGPGMSPTEEYAAEMAEAEKMLAARPKPAAPKLDLEAAMADAGRRAKGKEIYDKNCIACHTADGGGLVGPNLCDDYFIHGPTAKDSVRVITEGVPEKGMIAWGKTLSPEDVISVAAYIHAFRGTTPANPKDPQGDKHASAGAAKGGDSAPN